MVHGVHERRRGAAPGGWGHMVDRDAEANPFRAEIPADRAAGGSYPTWATEEEALGNRVVGLV